MSDEARILGGSVSFMERKKLADYEHREARAELTFAAPDGDFQEVFDKATGLAVNQVRRMLLDVVKRSTPGRPPGARNKEKEPVRPGAEVPNAPIADIPEPTAEEALAAVAVETAEPTHDPVPEPSTTPAVSDQALQEACARKNQKLMEAGPTPEGQPAPAQRIRALVAEFAGPAPKRLADMPAQKRQAFLDALAVLA